MKICEWCCREISWWRVRYCEPCGTALKLSKSSPPPRPTYAAEVLNDARRRRRPEIKWM